jgi:hypothetical protein
MSTFNIISASINNVQAETINVTMLNAMTSSINYVTSSQLNIGTNIITVNAAANSVRFGGLAVNDSGSLPLKSGSLLFDSQQDQWIFIHQSTATVTSSLVIMGPETYNNVGNEIHPTTNRIMKSITDEHIGDSNISDDGTTISINSNATIAGTLIVGGEIMGIQGQILALVSNNNLFSGF